MKTLTTIASNHISGYTEDGHNDKMLFHRLAKSKLRKVAKALGLAPGEYDLRTNKAGPAVCGETTLHTDSLYVQVSQSCMGPGNEILFRACDGRKDYCGKRNNFAGISALDDDPVGFAAYVNMVI